MSLTSIVCLLGHLSFSKKFVKKYNVLLSIWSIFVEKRGFKQIFQMCIGREISYMNVIFKRTVGIAKNIPCIALACAVTKIPFSVVSKRLF